MLNNHVEVAIFDTTLRDGAQSLPQDMQFSVGAKQKISNTLAETGINIIEAGFPATPSDFEEVKGVADTTGNTQYETSRWSNGAIASVATRPPVIAGLSRTVLKDIEITWDAVNGATMPRIHTFISTDEHHIRAKFPGKSHEEVLSMGIQAIKVAKALTADHPGSSIEFSAEAASTTQEQYLEHVVKEVANSGVDVINLPDTVGQRDPFWMYGFYSRVIAWVHQVNPSVTVSAHNHNDLGMAAANSYSLVKAAADFAAKNQTDVPIQIEGTVCGLGERAGNADLLTVMGGLYKFTQDLDASFSWEFNPAQSVELAVFIAEAAGGQKVHRQNPIVGSDTNTHRSGIHSDGVVKGGYSIYTPHDPTFWGHSSRAIHEDGVYQGKSGRAAISDTH